MTTATAASWKSFTLPEEYRKIIERAPRVVVPANTDELVDLSTGGNGSDSFSVLYDLPDGRRVVEVRVARVRNGIVANPEEPSMRRRDPDCMVIADDQPTDKPRYRDRFGKEFDGVRQETLDWLANQELLLLPFFAGQHGMGAPALAIMPANAAFFAFGIALLQGMLGPDDLAKGFKPEAIVCIAPPFRHTHFGGKQIVVHNRRDDYYEMFSYNLYPGPSAKKGVYGMLIGQGEKEGWITAHCSTVRVITPYDNGITMMHEGASGGGKSEMLQQPHRMPDGRLLLGKNINTGEERYLEIPRTCELLPVTDDMALCHPSLQKGDGRLWVTDAEDGWFVRVDHIREYGTDRDLEALTAQPPEPLLFMSIDAVPGSRAMIWEHIEDAPGKPCPNPRVILPRRIVPGVINNPMRVSVRSLGVRTPPSSRAKPNYGIMGLFHVLPPALAWLWRLVAPRGHANPSIVDAGGLSSEGVGSYWPFATGRQVPQANLLLDQIVETDRVRYVLVPNQHIGVWKTGFMPQWVMREYVSRRGHLRFRPDQILPARCPLLGWSLAAMNVEGRPIPPIFLRPEIQPELGEDGYDAGAKMLTKFFHDMLRPFLVGELSQVGRDIITCCLDGGGVTDYETFIKQSDEI